MSEPEQVELLLTTPTFRLERIVSAGHVSPPGFWYDQDEHEWVCLLSGAATLEVEGGEPVELKAGSTHLLPARTRHRVAWTSPTEPTVWLALFFAQAPLGALSADHVARIVGHMNDDHGDSLLDYARHLAGAPSATSARMTQVDAAGFGMTAETPDGPRQLRLPFDASITDAKEARVALVAMAKRARELSLPTE
jgi:cupin 2 domain-containing protein